MAVGSGGTGGAKRSDLPKDLVGFAEFLTTLMKLVKEPKSYAGIASELAEESTRLEKASGGHKKLTQANKILLEAEATLDQANKRLEEATVRLQASGKEAGNIIKAADSETALTIARSNEAETKAIKDRQEAAGILQKAHASANKLHDEATANNARAKADADIAAVIRVDMEEKQKAINAVLS